MAIVTFRNLKTGANEQARVSLVFTDTSSFDVNEAEDQVVVQEESLDFCLAPNENTFVCTATASRVVNAQKRPPGIYTLEGEMFQNGVSIGKVTGTYDTPDQDFGYDIYCFIFIDLGIQYPKLIRIKNRTEESTYNFTLEADGSIMGVSSNGQNPVGIEVIFKKGTLATDAYELLFSDQAEMPIRTCGGEPV